jgi:hypothetical protein
MINEKRFRGLCSRMVDLDKEKFYDDLKEAFRENPKDKEAIELVYLRYEEKYGIKYSLNEDVR